MVLLAWALPTEMAGSSKAARMPIMAMTTRTSTSVNAPGPIFCLSALVPFNPVVVPLEFPVATFVWTDHAESSYAEVGASGRT